MSRGAGRTGASGITFAASAAACFASGVGNSFGAAATAAALLPIAAFGVAAIALDRSFAVVADGVEKSSRVCAVARFETDAITSDNPTTSKRVASEYAGIDSAFSAKRDIDVLLDGLSKQPYGGWRFGLLGAEYGTVVSGIPAEYSHGGRPDARVALIQTRGSTR
jgi:hypothetical protein